ncbi:P-loop containing nucleoside triphosphate hydrolase protein [Piromyces finnis]|uniref:RNA helicase n=1 Tax=Piromyces finnis TaxID=1754191 RepID=A0A1Y1V669_9FUNG|nr:P-loop containing nucleoside triphosphate hydrolase protein [Piromyces finnis]|eukprot:ORX48161.1 P-loop containing nucleoside triphosphate hydrolase protein [Piromyces finnis]
MDFFKLLGKGTKFNSKRFQEDIDIFKNKSTNIEEIKDTVDVEEESAVPELDFFNTNKTAKENKEVKKDKNKKEKKVEETNENDIEPEINFSNQSEVQKFRLNHKIKIYGTDVPNPIQSFKDLKTIYNVKPYLENNLKDNGFNMPTPIQMQATTIMLHKRDLIACSPTGSGKTLSFIIPILHILKSPMKKGFRAVIISPTRELAQQIYREFQMIAKGKPFRFCLLSKATNLNTETGYNKNFDILISTPLRLVHAIQHESIKLDGVQQLVLDEADRLLELGFLEQMDEIIAACNSPTLQTSLFSATIHSGVESIARTIMKDPIRIVIGQKNAATETIKQKLVYVGGEEGKLIEIRQMIQSGLKPPVLIFVQSVERAKELFHELVYDGINVDVIHSERTKAQRDNIVNNFRIGKIWVLITTELMARGMDFKGVKLVINYDFPQSVQSYIHRIGRTGRAGRDGEAVTFFSRDDVTYLKSIVNVMKSSGCDVPDWMLELKKPTKEMKKKLRNRPIQRKTINTMSKYDKQKILHKQDMINNSKKRKQNTKSENNNKKQKSE